MNPVVDYRFGELHYATEFVTPANSAIKKAVMQFNGVEGDELVEKVASFIRDSFQYPLVDSLPSADGQLLRFRKSLLSHHFKKCVDYMWSFPSECLHQKLGICIDTSNLSASLLVTGIDAWVCLGEVRSSKEDTVLGLHAWVEVPYKGKQYVQETTIHEPTIDTLITAESAYDKGSDWAKQGNIYYVPGARYNDEDYEGDESIIVRISLPARKAVIFGADGAPKTSRKKLRKEWKSEEVTKMAMLKEAYSVR